MSFDNPPLNTQSLSRKSRPQIVANRGQQLLAFLVSDGWTRLNSRYRFTVGPGGIVWLQVGFDNFITPSSSGEQLTSNSLNLEASLEITTPQRPSPDGAASISIPLTFNGASSVILASGGRVFTDAVAVNLDSGVECFVRSSISLSNGQSVPVGHQASTTGEGAYTGTGASQANATGPINATGNNIVVNGYGPSAIIGKARNFAPSVLLIGDSNGAGSGDASVGDGLGNVGFLLRGLATAGDGGSRLPSIWQCRGADWLAGWQARNAYRRQMLWQYGSAALIQLGTNDIAPGRTPANCLIDVQAMCKWLRGHGINHIAMMTLFPRTTSTDNFKTAVNQTPASRFAVGGERDQFNNLLPQLVQQGLVDKILDPNPYVEDPSNKGKWLSDGTTNNLATGDGSHVSSPYHIVLGNELIKPWAQSLRV